MAAALQFHSSELTVMKMEMIHKNVTCAFRCASALIMGTFLPVVSFQQMCVTQCVADGRFHADWKNTDTYAVTYKSLERSIYKYTLINTKILECVFGSHLTL